jgi:CheY-like chemotaxis protein
MNSDPLAGRQILIVEDDAMIAAMLVDMLDEIGCKVAGIAAKPAQALAIIGAGQAIDAAILDVNLGGNTSFDIAAALEERRIPFLFSTGYTAVSVQERYRGRPFLQKPFRQEELQRALSGMLPR